MKKGILTSFIVGFSILYLFAQLPPNSNKEIKKVGDFKWKWTAADSLNILQNPFIVDPIPTVPNVNYWDGTLITPDPPVNRQYIINDDSKLK